MNIPKLRFKEFEGEWEKKKLNQVIDFKSGYAFKSSAMSRHIEKYQLIKMSNVYKNILALDRNPSYWKKLEKSQYEYLLEIDDIVLTLTGTIGKKDYGYSVRILENNKFLLNQRLVRLRALDKISNAKFIHNLILNERFLFYFFKNSKGGTGNQSNVSVEDLKQIKLNLPQLHEQQKIATFLSTIDQKIEQLTKKKTLLESYKKGVMQKIFAQQIRFKRNDGGEFEDWEEKRLGDVSIIIMGQSPDSKSYNNHEDGVYLIQGNADIENRVSKPRNWTSKPTKMCQINDLILTVRAPVGAIAKSLHNACIGRGVCAIRNNEYSEVEYLYQYLLWFEPRWISLEQGSTFTAVGTKDIKSLKIPIPSLVEQQKIATFLTSLDQKITQITQQIEAMKRFKKGLLQRMFV